MRPRIIFVSRFGGVMIGEPKASQRPERPGLFLASLALVVVHVAAVVASVHSIYALRLGSWSETNYGAVARNF